MGCSISPGVSAFTQEGRWVPDRKTSNPQKCILSSCRVEKRRAIEIA